MSRVVLHRVGLGVIAARLRSRRKPRAVPEPMDGADLRPATELPQHIRDWYGLDLLPGPRPVRRPRLRLVEPTGDRREDRPARRIEPYLPE